MYPSFLGENWYRIVIEGTGMIPESGPTMGTCGTIQSGYMLDQHPSVGQTKSVVYCFGTLCGDFTIGKVANCGGGDFSYYLPETIENQRYCAEN